MNVLYLHVNVLYLQKWVARVLQLALRSLSPGRKIGVSFRTKYADLNVPFGFVLGNVEGLGETKLTVSLGASH